MTSAPPLPVWYSMPAAFTLQPTPETRSKQLEMWTKLVGDHCKTRRQWVILPDDPIFQNKTIDRRLSEQGVRAVMVSLVGISTGVWLNKRDWKQGVWVLGRSLPEWAADMHTWASSVGQIGSVCTVFELCEGSQASGKAWEGMPQDLMLCILEQLESTGRAAVMRSAAGDGVKFL